MTETSSLLAIVHGKVQGVYFRLFVQEEAQNLGLTGYSKNLADGRSVEVKAEGEKEKLEELLAKLHVGPPRAIVERVDTEWSDFKGTFDNFGVRY